jgi:NAD(P)H-hydrate epimerase
MLVTCQQMFDAEAQLFSAGISAESYMDEAGRCCALEIRRFFPSPGSAEIFCGKGNNGGDALVIARWLKSWGWRTSLHFSHGRDNVSELARIKLEQYRNEPGRDSVTSNQVICVDGLLGIGAVGDLRGGVREQADRINQLRNETWATCFAVDTPSGLNADTGEACEGAVIADVTLTITCAKTGFASDHAIDHVGRIALIPLDIPVNEFATEVNLLFPTNLLPRLKRRDFDTHKGAVGKVVVIAGSRGLTGAASLTASGASAIGAGLVTALVSEEAYEVIAAQAPTEIMVRPGRSRKTIDQLNPDVIAIGPGLGDEVPAELIELMLNHPAPMVIDADALNALAKHQIDPTELPPNRVLTPHPGELARLTEKDDDRVSLTRQLADKWGVTLLHKGARSAIATPGSPVELNTTGHPGMASGGMGDVLTGMCAGLIGQGVSQHDAACLGSWLLGRAAELATMCDKRANESITAHSVASHLGIALRELQTEMIG